MTDTARPNWAPGMPETGPTDTPITNVDFYSLPTKNPHQAFLIADVLRPGFSPFTVEVEYTMYRPDTEKNAELELIMTEFPSASSMYWFTVIVPLKDLEAIRKVAEKYCLTLARSVTPIVISDGGAQRFPIAVEQNVFSIQGHMEDELLLKKYKDAWDDVIDKHSKGIPWVAP